MFLYVVLFTTGAGVIQEHLVFLIALLKLDTVVSHLTSLVLVKVA